MRCVSESFAFAKLFNECPYHFEEGDYVSFSLTVLQSSPISHHPPHGLSSYTAPSFFFSFTLHLAPNSSSRFSLFLKAP